MTKFVVAVQPTYLFRVEADTKEEAQELNIDLIDPRGVIKQLYTDDNFNITIMTKEEFESENDPDYIAAWEGVWDFLQDPTKGNV
jgi:hypothetical protein